MTKSICEICQAIVEPNTVNNLDVQLNICGNVVVLGRVIGDFAWNVVKSSALRLRNSSLAG
jgi:hypothetical protein